MIDYKKLLDDLDTFILISLNVMTDTVDEKQTKWSATCSQCGRVRYYKNAYNYKRGKEALCKSCSLSNRHVERGHRRGGTGVVYFGPEVDDWIMTYNAAQSQEEKERIYREHLHEPFSKLIEYVFNSTVTTDYILHDMSRDSAMHDCLSHVVKSLNLYDKTKGKAFSYFTISAKHHLMQWNNKIYEKEKNHFPISIKLRDEDGNMGDEDCNLSFEQMRVYDQPEFDLTEFLSLAADYWEKRREDVARKPKDKLVFDVIVGLFRNPELVDDAWNDLSGINVNGKQRIFRYIKDATNLGTVSFRKIIGKMKKKQTQLLREYITYGTVGKHC